ncbi:MAG: shikimate dehydrogenase [Dehalococcoidia bacterium]
MALKVDGETSLFITIGDPVAQTKSPALLSEILAQRGVNAVVVPAHVGAADLSAFMASVRLMKNLLGIVVTVPHKHAALAYCDTLTERATMIGAVNVIHRTSGGRWHGDNLDGVGFVQGLAKEDFDFRRKTALLVGAGGAGSAIGFELLAEGVGTLAVYDVNRARQDLLVEKLERKFGKRATCGRPEPEGYDLVVNATPLGMNATDPTPLKLSGLSKSSFVADIITKPMVSPMVEYARRLECRTMIGVTMFEAQAQRLADTLESAARCRTSGGEGKPGC